MGLFRKLAASQKNSTLIRYFLSYFIILSVLFLGFIFIVRNQLTNIYFRDLNQQTTQKLENLRDQFNDGLTSINQVHNSLINNINIILSRYSNEYWYQYLAAQKLDEYTISNSFIDSIVYFDKTHESIISSGNHVEYKDDTFYIYEDSSRVPLRLSDYENIIENQLIYLSGEDNDYLIYLPYNPSLHDYSVFYIINTMEVQDLLRNVVSDTVLAVALVDANLQPAVGIESSLLTPYLPKLAGVETEYKIDAETSACILPGIASHFSIVALISNQALLDQVNTVFQNTYLILVLLGVIGLFLILCGMNLTYLPLYRLTKKIMDEPNPSQNYLEQLDHAFTSAMTENQVLQNKIEKYRLSMQKSILDSIVLDNDSSNLLGFQNIDQFFNMEPDNHIFAIRMRSKANPFPAGDIIQFFHEALPAGDSCVLLESSENTAVFLINYSGIEQEKDEVIHLLMSDLYEESGYQSAISNSATSPLEIPSLYENAVLASNYWDHTPVISYGQIAPTVSHETNFSYPYKKLDELSVHLKNQNFSKCRKILDELFTLINTSITKNDLFPDFFIRCILIDILTAIISAMNRCNIKFKSYNDLYFETLYFCRSCPYEEKKDSIHQNIQELLNLFETEVESATIHPSQIQKMIEEHFSSPDFSITNLADSFDVSVAYMSYLFKKEFNQNFSDYIWDLRLEKAKELLVTTDMPIDSISVAVGYANTSSFRRKFKQETGQTPSQYRSSNQ